MLTLHANTLAALQSDHLRALLIKFDFTPSPVFITTAPCNIDFGGDTYLSNGSLLGLGNLKQSSDIRVNTVSSKFDAVDPSLVAILLSQSQHARSVELRLAVLNNNYQIIGEPILMDSLIIDGTPKITDDPAKGIGTIQQKIASEFSNWSAKNGRVTTPASQHKYFPSDTGLNFAAESGKKYKWGKK